MLKTLTLNNFALFSDITVSIDPCLTVITGETGAGKSMLMDALQFLQGKKLSSPLRDPDADTTVSVECDALLQEIIPEHLDAKQQQSLSQQQISTWTLSRTLLKNGRTKATLNNVSINAKQLQALVSSCIRSHSQHAHLSFSQETQQRQTLDRFGEHKPFLEPVRSAYLSLQQTLEKKRKIEAALRDIPPLDELQQRLSDLASLELANTNLDELNQEHRMLQNRHIYLETCQRTLSTLDGEEAPTVLDSLHEIQKNLESFSNIYQEISPTVALLSEAHTLAKEASYQLNNTLDCDYSQDHAQLQALDQKLATMHSIARRYRVEPSELHNLEKNTLSQIHTIESYQSELPLLREEIQACELKYQSACQHLHEKRKLTATQLSKHITSQLPGLNLPFGQFSISCQIDPSQARIDGTCSITFLFSANPGQDLHPLSDGASGGELARLALLLQSAIPAPYPIVMIFDEADVGVSGKTAILIGQLLKKMAKSFRVLCITHSPQVASCGQTHWHIIKQQSAHSTETFLEVLNSKRHIEEVARLLSGAEITTATLANAEQLCTEQA